MKMEQRTDLAMEARELWQAEAGETTRLPGVRARTRQVRGMQITRVEILDREGAAALGKPQGTYVTLELAPDLLRRPAGFSRAAIGLGRELAGLLPPRGAVLVAGLGNPAVTPDALGPRTLSHLVITRHLGSSYPQLRPVSAMAPGVLGTTGLESVEVIRGLVERAQPGCVVAVDALAACRTARLFNTVQLSDAGIVPGSGVRNSRAAFDRHTLGVPVVAVGVPTVADAAALAGETEARTMDRSLLVTSRDVDAKVAQMSKLLGYGISLGLQKCLSMEDISCFTEG